MPSVVWDPFVQLKSFMVRSDASAECSWLKPAAALRAAGCKSCDQGPAGQLEYLVLFL